jgi:hypothetical protein
MRGSWILAPAVSEAITKGIYSFGAPIGRRNRLQNLRLLQARAHPKSKPTR